MIAADEEPCAAVKTDPEDERDEFTALVELNADLRRHLDAWAWSPQQFISTLNAWIRRAQPQRDEDGAS
jgi:hypothetical protein